jgi:hypothetical protein
MQKFEKGTRDHADDAIDQLLREAKPAVFFLACTRERKPNRSRQANCRQKKREYGLIFIPNTFAVKICNGKRFNISTFSPICGRGQIAYSTYRTY